MGVSKLEGFQRKLDSFKWPIIVVVALICAVSYDHYRNQPPRPDPRPQNAIESLPIAYLRNPIELKNPEDVKLGPVEKPLQASVLFDEFITNERQARARYVGKTILVIGDIGESFWLTVPNIPEASAWYYLQREEHVTAGIMLKAEKSSDEPRYGSPSEIVVYMDPQKYELTYKNLLASREPNFNGSHQWSYDFYSDDFSAESLYGGVYCMFATAFSIGPYGFPTRKTKITAKCRVRGFERGGLETIEDYKFDPGRFQFPGTDSHKRLTKPRVILVGCEEVRSEVVNPLG